jgi:hypothetical protein
VAVAVSALSLSWVLSPRPSASADERSRMPGAFSYHPSGSNGAPELCDTRTGTVYRRTLSGTWEVFTKAPE